MDLSIFLAVYVALPLASSQLTNTIDPDATIAGNFFKPIKNNGNVFKPIRENTGNVYNIYVEQHHHFHEKQEKKAKQDKVYHPLGMAGQVSQFLLFPISIVLGLFYSSNLM